MSVPGNEAKARVVRGGDGRTGRGEISGESGIVAPVFRANSTMHERSIPLAGSVNLRDFGGYPTVDGGMVRRGRLFRSGALAGLSESAQQTFGKLRIGLICDLRRDEERRAQPTPFPQDAPRRLEIPISPGSGDALYRDLREGVLSARKSIDFMVKINRELARDHADDYARMFEGLLELEDQGFLVHCAAGKDRTGFACALILHALGVAEETVLEDYLLTNEFLDIESEIMNRLIATFGSGQLPDPELVEALAGVRPEYLRAAYQAIESEFEGVEQYLEHAIGLDAGARELLRSRLVETEKT